MIVSNDIFDIVKERLLTVEKKEKDEMRKAMIKVHPITKTAHVISTNAGRDSKTISLTIVNNLSVSY